MPFAASIVFFTSLLAIALLFALKAWEVRRRAVFLPTMREALDLRALQLKWLIGKTHYEVSKIPPSLVLVVRRLVHEGALSAASLSRSIEVVAYRIADRVSHRHRFERKETRSQFLKEVSEAKQNGSGSTDTSSSV